VHLQVVYNKQNSFVSQRQLTGYIIQPSLKLNAYEGCRLKLHSFCIKGVAKAHKVSCTNVKIYVQKGIRKKWGYFSSDRHTSLQYFSSNIWLVLWILHLCNNNIHTSKPWFGWGNKVPLFLDLFKCPHGSHMQYDLYINL
jgi:hypothetical protein